MRPEQEIASRIGCFSLPHQFSMRVEAGIGFGAVIATVRHRRRPGGVLIMSSFSRQRVEGAASFFAAFDVSLRPLIFYRTAWKKGGRRGFGGSDAASRRPIKLRHYNELAVGLQQRATGLRHCF
jgi:hypothetical protein